MIYAENQNVKTTPYKPPEGEAGRKFPRQYSKAMAANSKQPEPEMTTGPNAPLPVRDSAVPQRSIPHTHAPSSDGEPWREGLAEEPLAAKPLSVSPPAQTPEPELRQPAPPAQVPESEMQRPAPAPQIPEPEMQVPEFEIRQPAQDDTAIPHEPSPQQAAPTQFSEWADPSETAADRVLERIPDRPVDEASDDIFEPSQTEPPVQNIESGQPLTLEQEEQRIEDTEGGPIPSDAINSIPDLTPPGLTEEQAAEFPEYYEDASELRNDRPGPMADDTPALPHEVPLDSTGTILVQVFTARQSLPIVGARVTIKHGSVENNELVDIALTDRDGRTRPLEVRAPERALSEAPNSDGIIPYAIYDICVEKVGYYTVNVNNVQVFGGEQTLQLIDMTPLPEFGDPQSSENFTVRPQNL